MIVGVGLDLCSVARVRRALLRAGQRFSARICTPVEWGECTGDLATFLAGRFAAKEAFVKALGSGAGFGWHDVTVRRAPNGKPRLALQGQALAAVEALGVTHFHVTLTHDANLAVAVVVLERLAR